MKPYLLLMIGLCFLGAGCMSHYYRVDTGNVNLYIRLPAAERVYFSTSLDNFTPHPAKKLEAGIWRVVAPADREFTYFYNVDGNTYLPECRLKQKDDFGAENCLFDPDA